MRTQYIAKGFFNKKQFPVDIKIMKNKMFKGLDIQLTEGDLPNKIAYSQILIDCVPTKPLKFYSLHSIIKEIFKAEEDRPKDEGLLILVKINVT